MLFEPLCKRTALDFRYLELNAEYCLRRRGVQFFEELQSRILHVNKQKGVFMSYRSKSLINELMDAMIDGICKEIKKNKEFRDNLNGIKDAAWDGVKKGFKEGLEMKDECGKKI